MKTLVVELNPASQPKILTLQTLVSHLIAGTIPRAVRNRSFLVNDIPAGLELTTNADLVASVLSNLFTTVDTHSTNSCIRISAMLCNNVITVQLRDQHSNNTYTIANCLQSVQPITEKIGGYLGITSQEKNDTTIIFSFPNLPAAA